MGDRYGQFGEESTTTTGYTTAICLTGGTGVRPRVYDAVFGQGGTPGDTAVYWKLARTSAAGTAGSTPTPPPLDSDSPAAEVTVGIGDYSIEPTYDSAELLLEFPLNQRASYRWVAAPGSELVIPATSNEGIGAAVKAASYTGASGCNLMWEE
jgi:hypothetical protein